MKKDIKYIGYLPEIIISAIECTAKLIYEFGVDFTVFGKHIERTIFIRSHQVSVLDDIGEPAWVAASVGRYDGGEFVCSSSHEFEEIYRLRAGWELIHLLGIISIYYSGLINRLTLLIQNFHDID